MLLQELCGETWTDYNLHDPGVSILEQLCYGLTDLGRTLHEPLQALRVWAESHVEEVHAAQDRYDEAVDDAILRSAQAT